MSIRLSSPRVRLVVVLIAALAATIFGLGQLVTALGAPEAAPTSSTASADSLTTVVTSANWLTMDHDMSADAPGYQMPPQMMPGMPEEGQQRLEIRVSVTNTSSDTRPVQPTKEFILHSGKDGKQWPVHSGTFGELSRLAPRNAVDGILFFDLVPADLADAPAWVEWNRAGTSAKLLVPLNGADPGHSHTP